LTICTLEGGPAAGEKIYLLPWQRSQILLGQKENDGLYYIRYGNRLQFMGYLNQIAPWRISIQIPKDLQEEAESIMVAQKLTGNFWALLELPYVEVHFLNGLQADRFLRAVPEDL
jgi:hypothetical protein